MNASDYLEAAVLSHVFRNVTMASPSNVYVALFNGDPSSGGTEVTLTIAAARLTATFAAPISGVITNSADTDFGPALAGATITHFAIYDASSGGNMLTYGALLGGTQVISTSNPVKFASGDLSITLA